jgi:hypothetical protein
LARFADLGWPRKLATAWAIGQTGGVAIYLFLYLTHISKIRNNLAVWATGFGDTFYQFNQDSIFHFTRQNTWNIFQYTFSQYYVPGAMLVAFLVAGGFLLFRDFRPLNESRGPRHAGILFLLPFAAIWAAAIAGIYPYVGSRHTIILAPFAIAAASFSLAAICRQKLWAGALVAILLIGISTCYGQRPEPGIPPADQRRKLMTAAMSYVRDSVPHGDLIMADAQSALSLAYYYCGTGKGFFLSWSQAGFGPFECNGHLIYPLKFWYLKPETLAVPFEKMVQDRGLKPGKRVWIFQAGWGGNLMADLPQHLPQLSCVAPEAFGKNITIVPLMVGADLAPAPQSSCVK